MAIPKPAKPSRRMRGRRNRWYMLTHALCLNRQWCFYKFDLKYILIVFVFPVSDMIFKYLEAFLFQPRSQGLSLFFPSLEREKGREEERPWERGCFCFGMFRTEVMSRHHVRFLRFLLKIG